jgi:hypothetical protein
LVTADKTVQTVYDSLSSTLNRAFNSIDANKTLKLISSAIQVYNHKNYTYNALQRQMNGDQVSLFLRIEPRDTSSRLPVYETGKITFPLQDKKSFIATTAGFYGSWLENDAYSIETVTQSDTTYRPVKEESSGEIGTYLQVGIHFPLGDHLKGGVTFGPALSLSKPIRPRLTAGFSLSYGNRNMISIGLGVIGGHVDRKSAAIQDNTEFEVLPSNIVVSKLDFHCYLGIGISRRL